MVCACMFFLGLVAALFCASGGTCVCLLSSRPELQTQEGMCSCANYATEIVYLVDWVYVCMDAIVQIYEQKIA